jgi:hypothetical protein
MRKVWTFYSWVMVLGAVFTLAPSFLFALAILSGGLLAPLMILPTAAYYGLALLPFSPSMRSRLSRWPRLGLSLFSMSVLLFAPNYIFEHNRRQADDLIATFKKPDPENLDIVVEISSIRADNQRCEEFCQALLSSSRVASVTLAEKISQTSKFPRYRRLSVAECKSFVGPSMTRYLQLALWIGDGTCVAIESVQNLTGDLRFRLAMRTWSYLPNETVKFGIDRDLNGAWSPIVENEQGIFRKLLFPPTLTFGMSGGVPDGDTQFAADSLPKSHFYLAGFLGLERLQPQIQSSKNTIQNHDDLRTIRVSLNALLVQNPKINLNENSNALYEYYLRTLSHLHANALNEEDRQLLNKGLKAGNFAVGVTLSNILVKSPELLKENVAFAVSSFKSDCSNSHWVLYKIEPRDIAPYADDILGFKGGKCHEEARFKLAGRLGMNPVPVLAPLSKFKSSWQKELAIESMCVSDAKWRLKLMPELVKALPTDCVLPPIATGEAKNLHMIIKTLDLFGGYSEVEKWLSACKQHNVSQYATRNYRLECR